jgi:hypothetical protein
MSFPGDSTITSAKAVAQQVFIFLFGLRNPILIV